MPSTNVNIIIKADDQASAKFKQVEKSMESTSKKFKEAGGTAKASTELVGTFASTLGATPLGAFAGGLAQLTERMSAFSEVANKGGAGALAFKAGLVAAVGVITFQIGKAIGEVVFQTKRWNKELEDAVKFSEQLNSEMASIASSRRSDEIRDLEAIADFGKRREAAEQKRATLLNEQAHKLALIKSIEQDISGQTRSSADGASATASAIVGILRSSDKNLDVLRQTKTEAEQWLQASKDQLIELNKIIAAEEKIVELKEDAREKEIKDRRADMAAELQAGIDAAVKEGQDIEARERERMRQEKQRQQENEAREAERLAKEQVRIKEQAEKERVRLEKAMNAETHLQATESRLLTRGSSGNGPAEKTALATTKTAEGIQKQIEVLEQLKVAIERNKDKAKPFEVVG